MSEAQFRIGGHYKQRDGSVVQVIDVVKYNGSNGHFYPGGLALILSTGGGRNTHGACCNSVGTSVSKLDLLPGELHQVNGEWVPLCVTEEPKPPLTLGAILRQALDRLERGTCVNHTKTPTLDKLENTTERVRPPLDWNKPTSTDRFPGFTVSSGSNDVLHTMCVHPLQRIAAESDPMHGSAWLKG